MRHLKPLLLFLFLSEFSGSISYSQAPVKNYEKDPFAIGWKKAEELVKKNLPKSALVEVKKIYSLAKAQKLYDQVIKSLVYMVGLQSETREENETLSIKELEKEILGAEQPAKSILQSLVAEMYWNFFQNNRWKLYNRTQTTKFTKDDMATWAAADFSKKIGELYLQSIKEEKLLQQTKLEPFDVIITKGNVRSLRPTLYDLLAHRALDYFKNDEREVTRPAFAFEINSPAAFDLAPEFVKHKFTTKDSQSLQFKALLLYQKLISFHLTDIKPDALIDVDINRIEYVYDKGVQPDKKELYLKVLNQIVKQYENLPAAAQAWYLIAQQYENDAATFKHFGDSTHRLDRIKARLICEKVLAQKDSSEGKINCYNLLNQIVEKDLQFSIEKVNVPGQPFRALIEYRNFTNLYLRVIKIDEKLKDDMENYNDDKFWNKITGINPVRNWQQTLPATIDMQQHSVEIKIDALSSGDYMLIASAEKDFRNNPEIMGARLFHVSNISYVNNNRHYFVLNRETGQPLAQAAVQVWERKYNYKTSDYKKEKAGSFKTDDKGYFLFDKKTNSQNYAFNYLLDITFKDDRLFMNDWLYDYYYSNTNNIEQKESITVFLFADRSIYRPGQTVYFKGIAVSRILNEKNSLVKQDYETKVYLRNANYQLTDSMTVKTNEYGSFSGKFQLPPSGLNGNFTLFMKDNTGSINFSMEEYKRPKFYVDFEPVKGTYKVNELIKVTGFAKAYAGNNIDGATVKYRVVRQPKFIYPWLFWRWWQPPVKEMEIANGELKSDKDGKFIIEFTAIPDLSIDKKFEPVFDYRIYTDVTDINGETRSGEQTVSVSYKSLLLNVSMPATLPTDSLNKISIRTENMNGSFEPAKVNVTITRLKEEKRLIRARFWQRPDQFVMSKEEYIRNFPLDEYDNESDYRSWEKGEKIFEKADSVWENSPWSIVHSPWLPGFYTIEITTIDKNGEEVKDVKYIELYNEKSNQLSKSAYLWALGSKPIEPGEKTNITLGTSVENLFVIQQLDKKTTDDRQQSTADFSTLKLSNEKKTFDFTATEADRGGFGVSYFFVKNNRFFQFRDVIRVPWTNKDLKIEYATFRDKTLPGSEEKWKVKITGYKNEKVAAEMLAGMYDASLDQFKPHSWSKPPLWSDNPSIQRWNGSNNFAKVESNQKWIGNGNTKYSEKYYDELISMDFNEYDRSGSVLYKREVSAPMNKEAELSQALEGKAPGLVIRGAQSISMANQPLIIVDGIVVESYDNISPDDILNMEILKDAAAISIYGTRAANGVIVITTKKGKPRELNDIKARKNFNETAFFFPDLHTDSTGAIEFSFTMPEALTKWKFQALAHTKDLSFGLSTKEIVTQKQLMVQPNAPRFLREGDKMEFSTKIVNLSEKEFTGTASLQLFDAATNQTVDGWFSNMSPNQYFTVAAGQSEAVNFPIQVPYLFNKALVWRIVATAKVSPPAGGGDLEGAGAFSDGEENALPVLTNKMLVTETMPLTMKGNGTKNFTFTKLLNSGASETLQNHALTIEYTSNPAWYAVQALPYMMEYPYDCAEQVWNRYYANSLATMIANSSPRMKLIFEQWKIKDTAALMSNLQKNQELKAILLEETPWVLQAKNEEEQKKNIALLFDMVRMSNELNSSFEKLKQMQSSNGGFVWFKGGPDDRYITQYIVTGIGHLKKLNGITKGQDEKLKQILVTAIPYLDRKIKEDYDNLKKYKTDLKKYAPGYTEIQYLYMRSFFPEYPIPAASQTAYNFYRERNQKTWTQQSKYMQGMIALSLHRTGDSKIPAAILKSLKETSITHEELGMYWKEMNTGWFWYQAPIETQALLIEAFREIGKDTKTVDDLKTWLLKNKQTTNWKTTKATAEACYALLLQGSEWLSNEPAVQIKSGATTISSTDNKQEAGTGYFKKTIDGTKVNPEMGNISVTISNPINQSTNQPINSISWGGIYWQYFESLDKVTTSSTPLKLDKKLFVEKNTDRGPVLTPVKEGDALKVGDKIKVRIEIRVDRDMEYVHMKDMRASALEPVNVLSSYKWQGGLGYYESTKDASTHFFFSYLRKGTYVFEYPLFVTNKGNFSNGVTTIQCMYAPEYTSHSEGIRINVE